MYLSKAKKEKIKAQAITELFNSKELQKKIEFICLRHNIPLMSDIQSDILQVTFENLAKYDTDKFVQAYLQNPARILGLATTIAVRKGVLTNKNSKSPKHSIAQYIMHQSTLNTDYHINTTDDEAFENLNINLTADDDVLEEYENENENMWFYVKQQLTTKELEILELVLQHNPIKLKGEIKKRYITLLPKLKEIITQYQNSN